MGTDALWGLVAEKLLAAKLIIGFNLKFDLHWARRMGTILSEIPVWDCQLAHFILTNQQTKYPSLEGVCAYYGLEGKDDLIKSKYWENGIDTPDIPPEEMLHYLSIDLLRTMQVYEKQVEHFKQFPKLYKLFRLQCQDLHVLAEMEWNGLILDVAQAQQKEKETLERIAEIEVSLNQKCPNIQLNWDSGDDVSCFLYGGVITRERREVAGVYKTGQKLGQLRYRIEEDKYELPQLTKPIKGSELKKDGYYSTDEGTLRQLTGVKSIVDLLLERAKLSKLLDYFSGLPSLIKEMDWPNSEIHGQLNQCVAITGRLSANKPNQQNQTDESKQLLISRYG